VSVPPCLPAGLRPSAAPFGYGCITTRCSIAPTIDESADASIQAWGQTQM
jgi:hypothetical protein